MSRRIYLFFILLFSIPSVQAQNLLTEVRMFDIEKIEHRSIKKSRKFLKNDKERNLNVFTYFPVFLTEPFSESSINIDDILQKYRLWDKYCCLVYDDNMNIISIVSEKTAIPGGLSTHMSMCTEHIIKLKPEYVFEYVFSFPEMYLCYKDGDVIIVQAREDEKSVISFPLSQLRDVDWLNLAHPTIPCFSISDQRALMKDFILFSCVNELYRGIGLEKGDNSERIYKKLSRYSSAAFDEATAFAEEIVANSILSICENDNKRAILQKFIELYNGCEIDMFVITLDKYLL